MTSAQMAGLLGEAVNAAGVEVDPGSDMMLLTECQLYRVVRTFMHDMDRQSGKLDPKRYAYKAVAGGMSELLKLRKCP